MLSKLAATGHCGPLTTRNGASVPEKPNRISVLFKFIQLHEASHCYDGQHRIINNIFLEVRGKTDILIGQNNVVVFTVNEDLEMDSEDCWNLDIHAGIQKRK